MRTCHRPVAWRKHPMTRLWPAGPWHRRLQELAQKASLAIEQFPALRCQAWLGFRDFSVKWGCPNPGVSTKIPWWFLVYIGLSSFSKKKKCCFGVWWLLYIIILLLCIIGLTHNCPVKASVLPPAMGYCCWIASVPWGFRGSGHWLQPHQTLQLERSWNCAVHVHHEHKIS